MSYILNTKISTKNWANKPKNPHQKPPTQWATKTPKIPNRQKSHVRETSIFTIFLTLPYIYTF